MGRISGRLKEVRPDGTPVYTYAESAGRPPVTVVPMHDRDAVPEPIASHRGHAHDFHVLVYVAASDGPDSRIHVGGRELGLAAGSVRAVPPGQVVTAEAPHRLDDTRAWSVAFTPAAAPALAGVSPLAWEHHPLLALFVGDGLEATVPPPDRPRWEGWLEDLAEETADPTRPGAEHAVTSLLTRILVASARLAPAPETITDPLVGRVFEEIEQVFRRPGATATDIARGLGYTPGHLTTAMRERTGRTLLDWLTERRLTEARRLLRETDLPLGMVATRTGFGDAGYLVRRFRTRYGITPGRWRTGATGQAAPATQRGSGSSSRQ